MRLCTVCGRPSEASRCPDHKRKQPPTASASARGYDYQYRKLRDRALSMQDWCTDCGLTGTADNPMTLDHTPEAWRKRDAGKRLTIKDVRDGLLVPRCWRCNVKAGAARGGNVTRQQTP